MYVSSTYHKTRFLEGLAEHLIPVEHSSITPIMSSLLYTVAIFRVVENQ